VVAVLIFAPQGLAGLSRRLVGRGAAPGRSVRTDTKEMTT
jgi:hypothetical protein